MTPFNQQDISDDAPILEALETKPAPPIPLNFAARTALLARAQPPTATPAPRRLHHYGRTAAWISLFTLAVFFVALFPRTLIHSAWHLTSSTLILQSLIVLQIVALALWLGSRRFPTTT